MNPAEIFEVFLCADEAVAGGLFVTIASLLAFLSRSYQARFNLIDCGLSVRTRRSLGAYLSTRPGAPVSRVMPLQPGDLAGFQALRSPYGDAKFRPGTMARILAPYYFPDVSFGLYIDCDFLVQRDVSVLAELQDGSAPVYGVPDLAIKRIGQDLGTEVCRRQGVDPQAPYFNGGFQVWNLRRWDRATHLDRLRRIVAAGPLPTEDQSLLNVRFSGEWEQIDPDWDRFVNPTQWEYLQPHDGCNYHFYGLNKPWSFSPWFSPGLPRRFYRVLAACQPFRLRPLAKRPYLLWFVKNVILREGFRGRHHEVPSTPVPAAAH